MRARRKRVVRKMDGGETWREGAPVDIPVAEILLGC